MSLTISPPHTPSPLLGDVPCNQEPKGALSTACEFELDMLGQDRTKTGLRPSSLGQ